MTDVKGIAKVKLGLAERIIERSKELGHWKPMSNGKYPTAKLLADSHSLSELRRLYSEMM